MEDLRCSAASFAGRPISKRTQSHELHGNTGVVLNGLLVCLSPVPREFYRSQTESMSLQPYAPPNLMVADPSPPKKRSAKIGQVLTLVSAAAYLLGAANAQFLVHRRTLATKRGSGLTGLRTSLGLDRDAAFVLVCRARHSLHTLITSASRKARE